MAPQLLNSLLLEAIDFLLEICEDSCFSKQFYKYKSLLPWGLNAGRSYVLMLGVSFELYIFYWCFIYLFCIYCKLLGEAGTSQKAG